MSTTILRTIDRGAWRVAPSSFWRSLWQATPLYLFGTGVRAALADRR